jgi:hypothetical protein
MQHAIVCHLGIQSGARDENHYEDSGFQSATPLRVRTYTAAPICGLNSRMQLRFLKSFYAHLSAVTCNLHDNVV